MFQRKLGRRLQRRYLDEAGSDRCYFNERCAGLLSCEASFSERSAAYNQESRPTLPQRLPNMAVQVVLM